MGFIYTFGILILQVITLVFCFPLEESADSGHTARSGCMGIGLDALVSGRDTGDPVIPPRS